MKTRQCFLLALSSLAVAATAGSPAQTPAIPMAPPAAGLPALPAVVRAESPEQTEARLRWFREARFGLFIHWGVYTVPAGFWQGKPVGAEWIMFQGKIPVAAYRAFAWDFTAAKYDPEAWAQLAAEAGVKYVVITAKHHDGGVDWKNERMGAGYVTGTEQEVVTSFSACVGRSKSVV